MLSALARGYGTWTGDYDPDQNEPVEDPFTDLYNTECHRHGITVYPLPRTAHSPQSPRVVERPDGQLELPKTYLTRKGALMLFSSLQEAEKTEACSSPRRPKRSANLIDLSLKIGTLDRLSKSILQFGDEEYDREKTSVSESDRLFLKFLHTLDSDHGESDIHSQPGGDLRFYLRDLKSRASSRGYGGRDSGGGYRSHELREILRDLEGVWPPAHPPGGASDAGLHGDFFHVSGASETGSPRSAYTPRSRILSSRKLASSIKSATYLGRPSSAVSDASRGKLRVREEGEEDVQGLGRLPVRRSRRARSAYWNDAAAAPTEQPPPHPRSQPLPTPVEDRAASVPDVSSEGTGAEQDHFPEPAHPHFRPHSAAMYEESVATSAVEEEDLDLPSDGEDGAERSPDEENWPQPVTMVTTDRKSSELSGKQDLLPLSRPGSSRSLPADAAFSHLEPGITQPLQPQYKTGLLLLEGEEEGGQQEEEGEGGQEARRSPLAASTQDRHTPQEEPGTPLSERPSSAALLVRPGSQQSLRSLQQQQQASPRPSLTGRVASPELSEAAVASSKPASQSGSRPSSRLSQSTTRSLSQTVISVKVTRDKDGTPMPVEPQPAAASVVSGPASEASQRELGTESGSQGSQLPRSAAGSMASLALEQEPVPDTLVSLRPDSDAESMTSRKSLQMSGGKSAPQPEVTEAHVEKAASSGRATPHAVDSGRDQGPPTLSSSSSSPTPAADLTKSSDAGSRVEGERLGTETQPAVPKSADTAPAPAPAAAAGAAVPEKTATPSPPPPPAAAAAVDGAASPVPSPQAEAKQEEKGPAARLLPVPPTAPKPAVASPRKPPVRKEERKSGAKSYVKAMDIKGMDNKQEGAGKEEGGKKKGAGGGKAKEKDKWASYVPPPPPAAKVVVKEEKELVIPEHLQAAMGRNDALSAQQIDEEILQKRLEIEASLAGPTLEVEEGEGLTEEELKMAQEALQARLQEAAENLDKPSPRTPAAESPRKLQAAPEKTKKPKKGQKAAASRDAQSDRAKEREAIREQRKQEKLRRLQEAQELQEKIKAKEQERQKKEEEAARQQREMEEQMRILEREAEEIREAEEQAKVTMEATRKAMREEREQRRKADLERRKQMALARREKEKQMAESARQKEQEMLERIADAEMKRRLREEEQLREEEEERLAQEQFEEEMRAAQLAAEEDERRMQELERQAEEEALLRLVEEREQAEYQRRLLLQEAERMRELEEQKRQQMLLEEQRLAEERQRKEEEELRRREEEKQRLLELQRLEEETRQKLRQELEKRREEAMRRREKNLDRRDNLDKLQQGQAFTKPWVFSYYVHWPRETYLEPIGGSDDAKKKGKGAKKKK